LKVGATTDECRSWLQNGSIKKPLWANLLKLGRLLSLRKHAVDLVTPKHADGGPEAARRAVAKSPSHVLDHSRGVDSIRSHLGELSFWTVRAISRLDVERRLQPIPLAVLWVAPGAQAELSYSLLTEPVAMWSSIFVTPGAAQVARITDGMLRRGYSEERISKFLGGNLLRVFRQITEKR
jgi:hypothetical protein